MILKYCYQYNCSCNANNTPLVDRYKRVGKEVGQGTYGSVYRGYSTLGRDVALKRIRIDDGIIYDIDKQEHYKKYEPNNNNNSNNNNNKLNNKSDSDNQNTASVDIVMSDKMDYSQ
ncbi:hypothetical protein RFI_01096, partial [Reticulomyxa filosa]